MCTTATRDFQCGIRNGFIVLVINEDVDLTEHCVINDRACLIDCLIGGSRYQLDGHGCERRTGERGT
jgi:hypothetical protein